MNGQKHFKSKNKNFKFFFKKRIGKILYFLSRNKKTTYVFVTLILLILTIPIILSFTFFAPKNNVLKINFDKDNIITFDDSKLYGKLKAQIIGKNYYMFKIFDFQNYSSSIKASYPIVKNINLGKNAQGEVNIKLDFNNPSLIFAVGDRIMAVYSGNFWDISRSSAFLGGHFIISLPDYLGDLEDFKGFFYKVDELTLKKQMEQIIAFVGKQDIAQIIYYPGAIRTSVILNDKRKIFFSNSKDVAKQIESYNLIKNNYSDFPRLLEIDLAGVDSIIIKKTFTPEELQQQLDEKRARRKRK